MTADVKPFPILFVDGVDGTGKTTLVGQIRDALAQKCPDRPILLLRLPEDTGRTNYRTIVKSGPRTPDSDDEAAAFHMEDALLNLACFVNVFSKARGFLKDHPTGIVLFDRSPESIECYQADYKKNARYRYGLNLLREELYGDIGPSWIFVLKPSAEFIVNNLTKNRIGENDVIDDIIVKDAANKRDLYRSIGRTARILPLTNPQTYLSDVLAILSHHGDIPA